MNKFQKQIRSSCRVTQKLQISQKFVLYQDNIRRFRLLRKSKWPGNSLRMLVVSFKGHTVFHFNFSQLLRGTS